MADIFRLPSAAMFALWHKLSITKAATCCPMLVYVAVVSLVKTADVVVDVVEDEGFANWTTSRK